MSEKQALSVDDHPILRERLKHLLQLVSRKPIRPRALRAGAVGYVSKKDLRQN